MDIRNLTVPSPSTADPELSERAVRRRFSLNQHYWLADRMREQGIDFKQSTNAFLKCAASARLQELSDSLSPRDLVICGQKWLARLTPFFTAAERQQAGCQHRLFFSQVEFCDNIIFHRRAALDKLGERLLDANRTIGQPDKITTIFGRRVSKRYRGKRQTEIADMKLSNPVIRSHYRNGFIKQYVGDHLTLRTEPASNNVNDYAVDKAVENLPALRTKLSAVVDKKKLTPPEEAPNSGPYRLGGERLDLYSVAEVGQAFEQASCLPVLGTAIEVFAAEVLIHHSVSSMW